MNRSRIPLEERFWRKVDKSGECWIWTAYRCKDGYGMIGGTPPNHRIPIRAHRVSWELANGPIPPGLHVLHRCDNPPCVRPDHLFLGTDIDNSKDRVTKGRQATGAIQRVKRELPQSGYRGVRRAVRSKTWSAHIGGRPVRYLGAFPDPVSAAIAYDKAARELYGPSAFVNFPSGLSGNANKSS